ADCAATLDCLRALGVAVRREKNRIVIEGRGRSGLFRPAALLDARNSGTTMRLLSGILAGQPFTSTLDGDSSLQRRPMRRIIEPLTRMGATIASNGGCPPLVIDGSSLHAISHLPDVPSAQVKSCVLLAGLFATGITEVIEPVPTRDHTERALETFGVRVDRSSETIRLRGGQTMAGRVVDVPGDISGAAFWCALAAGTPSGCVEVEKVGLNPTRTAFLDVLRRAGADVATDIQDSNSPEPRGRLTVSAGDARSFDIPGDEVPGVIDEIPALAALASMMPPGRTMTVRGAGELRVKESDRISALAAGFRAMGAGVEEFEDGFSLESRPLHGAEVDAAGDHRLAMAFAIAATRASAPVTILGASSVNISYPGFFETLIQITYG
ncbi:MAG: 3-phosphoshikimate 1-carboxyvinyltransferase, partial [Planctomycetota bacterium]|nr:3-phosphoshikimate 1-carboxyvinyltransferase [Planctomycetota bacterium]